MLLTTIRSGRASAATQSSRRAAFTLLEVLIVVAILVILASAASIGFFRYLEEAKVGRAKTDMRAIEKALQTYYINNETYPPPDQIVLIAPYLEQGQEALKDPWGQLYSFEIKEYPDETDGQTKLRPVVFCQPPGNKPLITVPDINKGR
jgi:general secretion pathway protein G